MSVTDGGQNVVQNTGNNVNWDANFYRNAYSQTNGTSASIDFKVDNPDSVAHFALESSDGGTYSRWAVIAASGKLYVQYLVNAGAYNWVYPKDLINPVKTNVWYRLTLRVDDLNGFRIELRERDGGAGSATYTYPMPAGQSWRFHHWIYRNTAYLDNYVERTDSVLSTVFIGNYFEQDLALSNGVRSYYYLGCRRVARGNATGLYFIHGDQLGSVSLVTSITGTVVTQMLFKPYGLVRWWSGMLETDYRFTGQRQESNAGLYDYGPRFYDNYLNRWLSPDTIVPDPSNPQSLNRYSYSLNNPVKYNDPSGHCVPACLPWIYVATPLTVNPVTVEAAGAVGLVGITGYGAFQVGLWAAEDNGPNYPLPSIDYMGGVQSTYSLAGTTTLSVDSGIVLYKAEGAVKSMAAHMGYTFQNPLGGWDPKKKPEADNSVETNARHIRDALHDIKDNLSRGEDLRSYLKDNLTEKQYNSFTKALDDYASGLQDGGWLREQIGNDDLSGDILKLLKDTGYTSQ